MARKDRTFSHFDVVRLACRNLSDVEESVFRSQIRGQLGGVNVGIDSILSMVCTLNKEEGIEFFEKMSNDPCGFNPAISVDMALAAFDYLDKAQWTAYRRAFIMEVLTQRKADWRDVFTTEEMNGVLKEIFLNPKSKNFIENFDLCEYFTALNDFSAQATNIITAFQLLPIPLFVAMAFFPATAPYLGSIIAFILWYESILTTLNLSFVVINQFAIQVLLPVWECSDFGITGGTGVPLYYLLPELPNRDEAPARSDFPNYPGEVVQ